MMSDEALRERARFIEWLQRRPMEWRDRDRWVDWYNRLVGPSAWFWRILWRFVGPWNPIEGVPLP